MLTVTNSITIDAEQIPATSHTCGTVALQAGDRMGPQLLAVAELIGNCPEVCEQTIPRHLNTCHEAASSRNRVARLQELP